MSLHIASQNTQYYLQAGYGLACAMASAGMALFAETFAEVMSLRFDHSEALSLWYDHSQALSLRLDLADLLS
jgi:hypothetical protein